MQLHLENKVVIVSGGARGIGEAIARTFAAEGAVVCVLGRRVNDNNALVRDLVARGLRATSTVCEMTDEAQVRTAVAGVLEQFGRIDVVVNNAGVNDGAGLRMPVAAFRASLEKNVVHCFVLVQACLDALVTSQGNIVNIGTKCATTGQGGTSGYVAAKGAIHALTREWALDLAEHGVRVNCVVPAEVMTPLYKRWIATQPDPPAALAKITRSIPLEHRFTTAQEIADTVVFTASSQASHTTGQILYVDGGYTHLDRAYTAPERLDDAMGETRPPDP